MIDIYAVRINNTLKGFLLNKLTLYLSESKQNKVKNLQKLEDIQRTIIADILVRISVCKRLGVKNKDIIFDKNEYGKPFLKGFHNFHFNISHSGEWVVCAIHNSPIGIDIEIIKQIDFKIAERIYSKYEYNELLNRNSLQKVAYFFDLWTLKESYVKAIGKGLCIPLNSFSFRFNEDNNKIEFISENEFRDYHFKQYNIDDNYKMAVCSCADDFPKDVILKEVDEIFNEALLLGSGNI